MSSHEAARAIRFHEPYVHVETLRRGRELPFDRCTACVRKRVEMG